MTNVCALLANGTVACSNVLPSTPPDGGTSRRLGLVSGLSDVIAIAAGGNHDCALLADHTVRCWGLGGAGQLGNGQFANSTSPVAVTGLTDAVALAAGDTHNCAIRSDGTVACWGDDQTKALGGGGAELCGNAAAAPQTPCSSTPVAVAGITNATAVAAGNGFSCALSGGVPYCWGLDTLGQLGPATVTQKCPMGSCSAAPVAVPAPTGVSQLGLGFQVACAVLSNGDVDCWPSLLTVGPAAGLIAGLGPASSVAGGSGQFCARLRDATAWCWGDNSYGQLGNDSVPVSTAPVPVTAGRVALGGFAAVSAGEYHSCGLMQDGSVWCWGTLLGAKTAPEPVSLP